MVSLAALRPCNSTAVSTIVYTHSSDYTVCLGTGPASWRPKTQPQIIFFCGQQVSQKDHQLPALGLLKGMKPPLKGFVAVSRAAVSASSESSRELLPACWPEPPQAGWSCSAAADEAAVLPQAVGHDRQSPRHRSATALWASTSSSMNEGIHRPQLEEKTAAQDSPSNPSSSTAAPRGAESRPWAENQKYLVCCI